MTVCEFLGKHVSCLLERSPFKDWPVERSVEDGLEEPIIQYVFRGHALALRCDQNEKISAIFLRAEHHNSLDTELFEIPFDWTRAQVLGHFGAPSKSGKKLFDPILGEYGAWDRFRLPVHTIHIEYRTDSDKLKRITIMRDDVAP